MSCRGNLDLLNFEKILQQKKSNLSSSKFQVAMLDTKSYFEIICFANFWKISTEKIISEYFQK